MTLDAPPAFAVLIPVKPMTHVKTRMAGVDAGLRSRLMAAFVTDATGAALTCPGVEVAYVVTGEPDLVPPGAERLPDEGQGDLNRALRRAAARTRRLHPHLAVAALLADLPCLRPDELEAALGEMTRPGRWFVADAAGSGTTLLAALDVELDPRFGAGSARAHLASGARPVLADVPTLRRDVDTEEDLTAAVGLGVGRCTAEVLAHS